MVREVAEPYHLMTADEFFEWSDGTDTRYELVHGILHAQAATSTEHGRIASRVITTLSNAARGTNCEVLSSGAGIRISDATVYLPDAVLVCDPSGADARYVYHPCLVVEVLSPSTELTDRREKLDAYCAIDELLTYLVIHQDHRRVERHWRDDSSAPWQFVTYTGGTIPLRCVDAELVLDDVYRGADVTGPT
jgi:Uma2 family endonuclease